MFVWDNTDRDQKQAAWVLELQRFLQNPDNRKFTGRNLPAQEAEGPERVVRAERTLRA